MTTRTRPYRRRRRAPIAVLVLLLAAAAVATWTSVFVQSRGGNDSATCPAPTAGPQAGEPLASTALDGVPPVPATAARVQVLNAGGQRRQANLVAAQFGDLGFPQAAPPRNDPFFPKGDMTCTAQIRFGATGAGAASTLSLVLPCAELVRDTRAGPTVDVAVGTAFGDLNPPKAVRDALEQLAAPAAGAGDPVVDPATLADAREARCG